MLFFNIIKFFHAKQKICKNKKKMQSSVHIYVCIHLKKTINNLISNNYILNAYANTNQNIHIYICL